MLLSVIVVSADSGESLRECVRRVLASTAPLELLLFDNASGDGVPQAVARAQQHDPRFRLIAHYSNLGFGAAVNRAAREARGRYLLLLNPDCLIEPTDIDRLLATFDAQPQLGLLGAVVCDEHGVPDPACRRRDPLLLRSIGSLFGLGTARVAVKGAIPDHAIDAEAVSGALMVLPHGVFEQLNGFDEGYFLHCEDLDLCRRVRDAGWKVMLAGDVRVLHGKGGSSRHRAVFVSRHKHRGMWRWFKKFDPAARWFPLRALVWLGIWTHFLLQIPGQWLRRNRRG